MWAENHPIIQGENDFLRKLELIVRGVAKALLLHNINKIDIEKMTLEASSWESVTTGFAGGY